MPLEVSGLKLYSVDEIAKMLKSTKPTIRAYFREGKIKGQKNIIKKNRRNCKKRIRRCKN